MNKQRYNNIERIGVNAIERIFIEELKWIFREQPIVDVGIDAIIEVVRENKPNGRFIATQIKSGNGNFYENQKSFTYYASDIHYNYWTNSNLPVILIGYIPEYSCAYWEVLRPQNFVKTNRQWKIEIPKKQKLSLKSEKRLLELVGLQIENTGKSFPPSSDYIDSITSDIKYLSYSKGFVLELSNQLISLNNENVEFNLNLKRLIDQNKGINDPQTKRAYKEFSIKIMNVANSMELSITSFSEYFAKGSLAYNEILFYCDAFGLEDTITDAKTKLLEFPNPVEKAISQITELKLTVEKFPKKPNDMKEASTLLAEVLNQVIREFAVAKETVENMIAFID